MSKPRIRVCRYRADMAETVLAAARCNGDCAVIAAAIRIREGWLYGRLVERCDLALVAAFA